MAHSVDPKQTTRAFAYEFWMKVGYIIGEGNLRNREKNSIIEVDFGAINFRPRELKRITI